jgi:hypothetical protein
MAAQITDKIWKIEDIVALLGPDPKRVIKKRKYTRKIKPNFRNRLFPYLTRDKQVRIPTDDVLISN